MSGATAEGARKPICQVLGQRRRIRIVPRQQLAAGPQPQCGGLATATGNGAFMDPNFAIAGRNFLMLSNNFPPNEFNFKTE